MWLEPLLGSPGISCPLQLRPAQNCQSVPWRLDYCLELLIHDWDMNFCTPLHSGSAVICTWHLHLFFKGAELTKVLDLQVACSCSLQSRAPVQGCQVHTPLSPSSSCLCSRQQSFRRTLAEKEDSQHLTSSHEKLTWTRILVALSMPFFLILSFRACLCRWL